MFKVEELVMYGGTGVCKIIDIGTPDFDIGEIEREYYFLEPLYQNGMIYAPVDNEKVSIRPVISAEEANALIDGISELDVEVFRGTSMQQMSQHYQKIIDTHKPEELLKFIKSIYAKKINASKDNKRLGQIDKRYMKKSEELLYGEFSAALDVDRDKVLKYVHHKLEEALDYILEEDE